MRRHSTTQLAQRDTRYTVETVEEFLGRGGRITRVPPAWSPHMMKTPAFLTILCGGSDTDVARGFALSDVPDSVREAVVTMSMQGEED